MINALSIDVEDWFCAHNLSAALPYEKWNTIRLRVPHNLDRMLALLQSFDVKATFFILGWIAQQSPDLVKRIHAGGHEVATHGYAHLFVNRLTQQEFARDLEKSLAVLYKACPDAQVKGFRAPSFSIDPNDMWVFDTLAEFGLHYDTSFFPLSIHPTYSNPDIPLDIYTTAHGIVEFPMSCFKFCGLNVPCAGGGYFRLLPYWYTAYGIRRCNAQNRPGIFYTHPWEIDPKIPRLKHVPFFKQLRHYTNLHKTETRLKRLLADFSFDTVHNVLARYGYIG